MDALARRWLDVVWSVSHTPMSYGEAQAFFRRQVDRLVSVLGSEPFQPDAARHVGTNLVHNHFTADEVLGSTVGVLLEHAADLAEPAAVSRMGGALRAVADGYQRAARLRMERGQEEIRRSHDVARRRSDDAVRLLRARNEAVFQHASDGMACVDIEGRYVEVNPALADLLGRTAGEFRHFKLTEPVDPSMTNELWADHLSLVRGDTLVTRRRTRFRHADGHSVWADVAMLAVSDRDRAVRYTIVLVTDKTREAAFGQLLADEHRRDPLTYLPNRAALRELLDAIAAAPETPAGLCVIDLDAFSVVNEDYGPKIGDFVLRAVADVLCREVGDEGQVTHLGGDRFAVLLPFMEPEDVHACARRLWTVLRTRRVIVTEGGSVPAVPSVGFAAHDPATGGRPLADALLLAAEGALRWAKAAGGDRVEGYDPKRFGGERTRPGCDDGSPRT